MSFISHQTSLSILQTQFDDYDCNDDDDNDDDNDNELLPDIWAAGPVVAASSGQLTDWSRPGQSQPPIRAAANKCKIIQALSWSQSYSLTHPAWQSDNLETEKPHISPPERLSIENKPS